MGWASGAGLFAWVWELIEHRIPENEHKKTLAELVKAFESYDCDNLSDVASDIPLLKEILYDEDYEKF